VDDQQTQEFMQELLADHGVNLLAQEGWLTTDGGLPAIRAEWAERSSEQTAQQLDVMLALPNDDMIIECFGGGGKDVVMHNFVISSLHVFLAAIWDRIDEEQVGVETWNIAGSRWRVFIGNWISRAHQDDEPWSMPQEAFRVIEDAVTKLDLSKEFHWLRFYVGNIAGRDPIFEALLNNQPWPEGLAALASINWPPSQRFYSTRLFLLLKKLH
jgi:hypothetical protein